MFTKRRKNHLIFLINKLKNNFLTKSLYKIKYSKNNFNKNNKLYRKFNKKKCKKLKNKL